MRVKVRNTFRDKNTKTLHRKNEEMEISEERFAEINGTASGFLVEEIEVSNDQESDADNTDLDLQKVDDEIDKKLDDSNAELVVDEVNNSEVEGIDDVESVQNDAETKGDSTKKNRSR